MSGTHDDHHGHSHQHDDHGHDHPSEHTRGHGGGGDWWGRARHWVSHVITPHSHDSADKIDAALETSTAGIRAVWWSFTALMITSVLQAAVFLLSGSVALLGDTLHNIADALTAVPLAIAFVVGRRAATRRYTYGYGRAEDLAGLVVVALIALSAAVAAYEAVDRFLHPRTVTHLAWVAAAGLVGFIGNELVARYRITVGRRIGSAALVADGLHARTDGFTSLAVLVGAAGVWAGFPLTDPIIGLLITVAITFVLKDAAREIYRRLMDAVDPDLVTQAETVVAGVDGVHRLGQLRLRWHGHRLLAEVEVIVDPALSLAAAHHIAHEVEHELCHALPRLSSALVHADPDGPTADHDHARLAGHRPVART